MTLGKPLLTAAVILLAAAIGVSLINPSRFSGSLLQAGEFSGTETIELPAGAGIGLLDEQGFANLAEAPFTVEPASGSMAAGRLKHNDGKADGRKSLGGSGQLIRFSLPNAQTPVTGLRVHGARYGYPQAPDDSVLVYFLNDDLSEIVNTQMVPYAVFPRSQNNEWIDVQFKKPVEVPENFWVAIDFRAGRTKGVYVSFDSSTGGRHSRVGLPGQPAKKVDFGGDWMIEVQTGE